MRKNSSELKKLFFESTKHSSEFNKTSSTLKNTFQLRNGGLKSLQAQQLRGVSINLYTLNGVDFR